MLHVHMLVYYNYRARVWPLVAAALRFISVLCEVIERCWRWARHHLFPDLPRHSLRRASRYVRPMCDDLGIEYHDPPFFQARLPTG